MEKDRSEKLRQEKKKLVGERDANKKKLDQWTKKEAWTKDREGYQKLVNTEKRLSTQIDSKSAELAAAEKQELKATGQKLEKEGVQGDNSNSAELHQTPNDKTSYKGSHSSYRPKAELKKTTAEQSADTPSRTSSSKSNLKEGVALNKDNPKPQLKELETHGQQRKNTLAKYQSGKSSTHQPDEKLAISGEKKTALGAHANDLLPFSVPEEIRVLHS